MYIGQHLKPGDARSYSPSDCGDDDFSTYFPPLKDLNVAKVECVVAHVVQKAVSSERQWSLSLCIRVRRFKKRQSSFFERCYDELI